MKKIKVLLLLLIVPTTFSCDKDNVSFSSILVGEWQRDDTTEDFDFRLLFNSDFTGVKIVTEGTMETEIISSLIQFNWSLKMKTLIIEELDTTFETTYIFNSEGQLILNEYSNVPFNKVE